MGTYSRIGLLRGYATYSSRCDMSDHDESGNNKKRKKDKYIPPWAVDFQNREFLEQEFAKQQEIDPESIFGIPMPVVDLDVSSSLVSGVVFTSSPLVSSVV
jgi:hypothetical protein